MATVVIGLVTLISEMGIGSAIVQTDEIDTYQQRCLFGAALLLNSSFSLILILSAPLLSLFFSEPRLEKLVPLLALQLPLAALATLPGAIAKRNMAFKALSMIEMASAIISTGVTLVIAIAGFEVWALVFGQLALAASRPILLILKFGTQLPAFGYKGLERIISFGTTITFNRIIWYFYSQADIFIAGKLLGKDSLGAYSIAVTLATLPMQKISSIINEIAFSSFSRIQNDKEKISAATIKSVELMGVVSIPLLWGLASVAPELIPVILGPHWELAIIPLQLVACITPLRMISGLISTITLGVGKPKLDLINTLISSALAIPAFIIGAKLWEINGLALAWLIFYPISFLIMVNRTTSAVGMHPTLMGKALLPTIISGLAMALIIYVIRINIELSRIILIPIEIISGVITYLLCISILNPRLVQETISSLRRQH